MEDLYNKYYRVVNKGWNSGEVVMKELGKNIEIVTKEWHKSDKMIFFVLKNWEKKSCKVIVKEKYISVERVCKSTGLWCLDIMI